MSSIPLQPPTLDAALETALPSSTSPEDAEQSSLSPADCCTPKKALGDVHSPSPIASPVMKRQDNSLLSVDSAEDGSSDTGFEDLVQYSAPQFDHGEELEAGYKDEDDSMGLSDAGLDDTIDADTRAVHADQSIVSGHEDDSVYVWSHGDTIEDIMNTPGNTAPPARPQHLDGVYRNGTLMPEEKTKIEIKRAALEKALVKERVTQELEDALVIEDETIFQDETVFEEQDNAMDLSDDSEFLAVQEIQAKTGLSMIEEEDAEVEFEYFEPNNRRNSRRLSPALISRPAFEDSIPVSSTFDAPDSCPAVVTTPSGCHLAFTPNATIPDTPFTHSLNYFKQHKGKENSPSKSRRNASLPEEIAELAKEAKEEEDLEKYRKLDLAPMEPVMESKNVGDLIAFGTLARSNISPSLAGPTSLTGSSKQETDVHEPSSIMETSKPMVSTVVNELPSLNNAAVAEAEAQISEVVSPSHISLPEEEDDATFVDAEVLPILQNKRKTRYSEPPTFVTVIGMLPEAMFWSAAAPVVKYSNKAYDALCDKFTKL